ncbi:AAA family ATPase [Pseudoalteromonas arabiensis]|uniref:AAA family ATPase n=1 Tax=Pseudoalteromonas arabiensis TaxID=874454 RepID=UPI0007810494|nr:AAA family ATPase [Pseudoalteromonas arabiensis]
MDKYITEITGVLPKSDKKVFINNIDGKNIIVTGINGCGKTSFLKTVSQNLATLSDEVKGNRYLGLNRVLAEKERELKSEIGTKKNFIKKTIDNLNLQMQELIKQDSQLKITFDNFDTVAEKSSEKMFVHTFFDATRQYESHRKKTNSQLDTYSDFIQYGKRTSLRADISNRFESYLVTFIEACYIAYAMRSDISSKEKADEWMLSVENDLKHLFEDSTLKFTYEEKSKQFFITQHGKQPYDLSVLSSGYSAILKIYAELILKVEFKSIEPKELSGIVFIDEIDAHLHVSLQKKILPFLSNAYPNIQFIVSTHSPFVLQSVDNAVVYDLTNNEQMEDLSLYSYEAILKGLLGVETNSDELIRSVDSLAEIIPELESGNIRHLKKARELTARLRNIESKLDSKSKVVLLMAEQAIDDLKG